MNSLGKKIKLIRDNANMTQIEFAKKLCISQPHLSRIEKGFENPSKAVLQLLCIQFNLNKDDLL